MGKLYGSHDRMPTAECGDRPTGHDCLGRAGEAGVAELNQPQASVSGPSLAPHQAGPASLPHQSFRESFVASLFRPTFNAVPFGMGVAQSFAFGAAVGGGGSIPGMGLRARRAHANAGRLAGAAAMLPSGATAHARPSLCHGPSCGWTRQPAPGESVEGAPVRRQEMRGRQEGFGRSNHGWRCRVGREPGREQRTTRGSGRRRGACHAGAEEVFLGP